MIKLTVFVTSDGHTFPATEVSELRGQSDRVARFQLRIETRQPLSEGWLWDADNNATQAHKVTVESVGANNSTQPDAALYRVCRVDRQGIDISKIPGLPELQAQQCQNPKSDSQTDPCTSS